MKKEKFLKIVCDELDYLLNDSKKNIVKIFVISQLLVEYFDDGLSYYNFMINNLKNYDSYNKCLANFILSERKVYF